MKKDEAEQIVITAQNSSHSRETGKIFHPSHKFGVWGMFENGSRYSNGARTKKELMEIIKNDLKNFEDVSIVAFSRNQDNFKLVYHN